jgi:hypothetical protein
VRLGRPRSMPSAVRTRIRRSRAAGQTLTAIAEALNRDGVPTAQGGRSGTRRRSGRCWRRPEDLRDEDPLVHEQRVIGGRGRHLPSWIRHPESYRASES